MLRTELSLVNYLLDAAGEATAVETAKQADPEIFQSYACRSALAAIKHSLEVGIWPDRDTIKDAIGNDTYAVLSVAMEDSKQVIDPVCSLGIIRNEYERRRQMDALSRGFHGIQAGTLTIDQVIRSLEFTRVKTSGWDVRDFADIYKDIAGGLALDPNVSCHNLIHTGLETIDSALASPPGTYGVIGAMPGVGKTSLMFHIAALSYLKGTRTVALSLETPESTLAAKTAASVITAHGGNAFVGSLLRSGGCNPGAAISKNIYRDGLLIGFHPAGLPWNELEAMIRVKADQGFQMFMIDYFTLLEPPDMDGRRNEASMYAAMSKSVKALCGELKVAIILVAQPNAEVKYGERPDPSQLATSRQVFRDYDFGLYIWGERDKGEQYQMEHGNQFRLLKAWVHKNRLFNCDDPSVKPEPEIYVEAELRRNWFKEIPPPISGIADAEIEKRRNRL